MKSRPHPSKEIVGAEGEELGGRRIVLCITGSVAAYRAVDMARLLMRHGAEVHAVMTESTAQLLLSEDMMKWATGNPVVTRLTGDLEHIRLADYGKADLILVYPCTANTIGKAASGIDDTPVTSVLSVALGSKIPLVIAPSMHEAMYENSFIMENVQKLKEHGVIFAAPKIAEGKAKVAEPDDVLAVVMATLSEGPLTGKSILITAGSTVEHIDPIRVITSLSTGTMGVALAEQARKLGAGVTLVYAHGIADTKNHSNKIIRVSTGKEMFDAVTSELSSRKYDIAIMTASVADFAPARKSEKKIDTRAGRLELGLVRTTKIVDQIRQIRKDIILVAFKADYNVDERTLIDKAFQKLKECNADLVVANDVGKVGKKAGPDKNEVYVVDHLKNVTHMGLEGKTEIARKLLTMIRTIADRK